MNGTNPSHTRFLVSVRSPDEAAIALSGGADIVDVKEPRSGALGSVAENVTAAIVRTVDGRRPISATIGDCLLAEAPERVARAARTGVDFIKVGLFGDPSAAEIGALGRHTARGYRLIGVVFADRVWHAGVIRHLAEAGFAGVMLDTAEKTRGGLREHMSARELTDFLLAARRYGLMAGLAGSLRRHDARALLPLAPDVLGFRGALCARGKRSEGLAPERVADMGALIRLAESSNWPELAREG